MAATSGRPTERGGIYGVVGRPRRKPLIAAVEGVAYGGGLEVVMDRCVKMEHGRYNGSLHWVGMNTELITARKARSFI